jgi:hypothetical protein
MKRSAVYVDAPFTTERRGNDYFARSYRNVRLGLCKELDEAVLSYWRSGVIGGACTSNTFDRAVQDVIGAFHMFENVPSTGFRCDPTCEQLGQQLIRCRTTIRRALRIAQAMPHLLRNGRHGQGGNLLLALKQLRGKLVPSKWHMSPAKVTLDATPPNTTRKKDARPPKRVLSRNDSRQPRRMFQGR